MSDSKENGYVINCEVWPRAGDDVLFIGRADGSVIAQLDGYAIIPVEELAKLRGLAEKAGQDD